AAGQQDGRAPGPGDDGHQDGRGAQGAGRRGGLGIEIEIRPFGTAAGPPGGDRRQPLDQPLAQGGQAHATPAPTGPSGKASPPERTTSRPASTSAASTSS